VTEGKRKLGKRGVEQAGTVVWVWTTHNQNKIERGCNQPRKEMERKRQPSSRSENVKDRDVTREVEESAHEMMRIGEAPSSEENAAHSLTPLLQLVELSQPRLRP